MRLAACDPPHRQEADAATAAKIGARVQAVAFAYEYSLVRPAA
ncbi:hypothetical protein ABZ137_02220 [Streptomyces bobili]